MPNLETKVKTEKRKRVPIQAMNLLKFPSIPASKINLGAVIGRDVDRAPNLAAEKQNRDYAKLSSMEVFHRFRNDYIRTNF